MTDTDHIFEMIAKEHLNIETLKTRNSDSLDFHDCSVWGVKKALQAAYDLGRLTSLPQHRIVRAGKVGTCYQGSIDASYQDLVEVWGEPAPGDKYKTEAEWVIRPADGETITIYNYKNSRCYADKYPVITEVREWHIGGHDASAVDRVIGMMAGRAKLLHRAK
ncbi:MAG: hypothetical protein KGJ13_07835 [Patescibacteria group bacterium]|nr:hypothetical protein [Patescibacteria group bacterium]